MEIGLAGKVAIVTGAASGLGRAIALTLAAEGARVAVADVDGPKARAAVAQLEAAGAEAAAFEVDVTKDDQVRAMVDAVLVRFGRIDILANNAGIVGPQGPWVQLPEEGFERVVGVNFKGPYLCAKAVIPHMIKQESGKIVNTASCAAKTGEANNGLYAATKAAVWSMTQSLALELGRYNINVNAVCPAAMDTELMETVYRERSQYFGLEPDEFRRQIKSSFVLPRELTVQDVANVVVFLASDAAGMMTGQAVNVTGGIEMH